MENGNCLHARYYTEFMALARSLADPGDGRILMRS